ncbi:MAG TPA: AAA family ATPase [bacterium]|nr:AAA family ATPase [bacterium]
MIIRRLRIRGFRKLVDQALECGPGLNVIYGRNDAGKSTLHLAVSAALFPVRPAEARSYATWGEAEAGEVSMEFEAGDRSYRLHRDLGAKKVSLAAGGETWDNPKDVERQIGEVLGLTSLTLFRATAHIRQWDLAGIQHEGREIGTRLARIVTGADTDATRVLRTIDDKIRGLEVGLSHPSKTPGPLKRNQDRIAALTAEQSRLASEVEAIERAATDRDRLLAQVGELEQQVRDDGELMRGNRRLLELDARSTQLTERATELQSLLDRLEKAGREAALAAEDEALHLSEPDAEALQRLQEADARLRILRAALGDGGDADLPIERSGPAARSFVDHALLGVGPAGFGLAAVVAGAVGVALLAVDRIGWSITLLVVAGLLGSAAVAARVRGRAAALEAVTRAARQGRVRDLEERRRAAEEAAAALRHQLESLGVPSVQAATDLADRCRRARHRQASSGKLVDELLGGRRLQEIVDEHRRGLLDLAMVRAEREDPNLALRRLDPVGFQRLQNDAAARARRLEEGRGALQRLDGRLSGRSPNEELARVEEELAEVRERIVRFQRFIEILRLTRRVLGEAHRLTVVPGKALLEERASRYLRVVSDGAYDRVEVDEHTLAPRVWVGPPKGWAEVDAASREIGSGAADQCYLALRLALIDVLCEGRRPPLFLDDPFLAYDEGRKAAAMRLLGDLSRERQIFLFTCHEDYHRYADHLIILGHDVGAIPQELGLSAAAPDEVSANGP